MNWELLIFIEKASNDFTLIMVKMFLVMVEKLANEGEKRLIYD
jgi:hypothetical protein